MLQALRCSTADRNWTDSRRPASRGKHSLSELLCLANRSTAEIQSAEARIVKKGEAFEYGAIADCRVSSREQLAILRSLASLRNLSVMLISSRCSEFNQAEPAELRKPYQQLLELTRQLFGANTPLSARINREILPFYLNAANASGSRAANDRVADFLSDSLSFMPQVHLADLLSADTSHRMVNAVYLAELAFRCSANALRGRPHGYFFGMHLNLLFGNSVFAASSASASANSASRQLPFVRDDARARFLSHLATFISR